MKKKTQKPLTLDELANYNQKVLLPAIEERFLTKREFNEFKTEMNGFKDESLSNQDAVLKKLPN